MGDFFSTKGINSLFLFISLYCVIDMFFIACNFNKSNELSQEYWFACCTMLSTIGSIVYFCLILFGKTKNVTKGKLYVIVTGIMFVLLILSIFAYSLNSIISSRFTLMREETFLCLSDTLAVILPFWGFILCLVFITCIWMQINVMIKDSVMTLRELHGKLHNRKLTLDKTYDSFKPSEQMKFN